MNMSILDMVHESAKDLKRAGVIDEVTMREFDALCLPKVREFTPQEIQKIREVNNVSQPVFAAYFNVTPSSVKKWESGDKRPRGTSLKLLNLVERKGLEAIA